LPVPARDHLVHGYVAAVYLQRLWWIRLRRYLGEQPPLPPLWIDELGLPAPDERFGKLGLIALNRRARAQRVTGSAGLAPRAGATHGSSLGEYFKVAQQLLGQSMAERAVDGATTDSAASAAVA
jgi:hypothetical protein